MAAAPKLEFSSKLHSPPTIKEAAASHAGMAGKFTSRRRRGSG